MEKNEPTQETPQVPYYGMSGYPWQDHRILSASNGYFETHNWNDEHPTWKKIEQPDVIPTA